MSSLIPETRWQAEVERLISVWRQFPMGHQSTKKEIMEVIGEGAPYYYVTQQARKILRREHNILYIPVRAEGMKRAHDGEATERGFYRLKRIRTQSKDGKEEVRCARFDVLTQQQKMDHNAIVVLLGIEDFCAGVKARNRVRKIVSPSTQESFDATRTLSLFTKAA
jgi:predicted metallopeptidase